MTIANLAFKVGEDEITSGTEASSIATIKENPTYGDSWETIVSVNSEVKAYIGEKEVQGKFSVKDSETKPTAGEDKEYTIVFNSTDGIYKDITVFTGTVSVAQKEITIGADSYTVTKEYDGKTTAGEGSGNLTLIGVEDGDEVSVEVVKIGEYSAADVTADGKVNVTVKLVDKSGNYKLASETVEVKGVITAKNITPTVEITSSCVYTGEAQTPDSVVVKNGTEVLTKDTDYTVEYKNNTDAGKATATIKAASGKNFTFGDINVEFEIAKAKLTATGEGKASGTYGAKLSGLKIEGLTAKLGEKTIEGTWAITGAGSDAVPNVGDTEKYTATFTPTSGGDNFETLTEKVSVSITKATYSTTISDTEVSFNKNTSGKKTVQLALPVISGFEITKATATAAEGDTYIAELNCDKTGKVSFEITANSDTETERTSAEITVTLSSNNYEDITAKVKITFTDAVDQEAPEKCDMTYEANENGTYTVTIATVEGAEYSFDGTTFSENNTKTGVAAGTTVTGYIRMKAVEASGEGGAAKNASPATSASITTPKAVSAVPTITKGATFKDSIEVTITATDGAATIYYTTDGSNPTTSSTKYTGAFTLTKTATVKAIAVSTGKEPSEVVSATFTKESSSTGGGSSSGGSRPSGGSYGGGSSSSTKTNPTVDGKEKTWADTAKDIEKLPAGKEVSIEISGSKEIPADVIKAIAKSDAKINVEIDNAFSWTIDGSDINEKDAKAADLTINKASVSGTNALRGISGTSFKLNGTNVNSKLNISFEAAHAGKFANLFKKVDGKFVFVDNVKIDKNGNAIGLDVSEKGEYVVMLGEFSDRTGDMDNDGIVSAYDALAVLKESVGLEKGVNPLVADLDGDGFRSAMDALAILKMTVGLL